MEGLDGNRRTHEVVDGRPNTVVVADPRDELIARLLSACKGARDFIRHGFGSAANELNNLDRAIAAADRHKVRYADDDIDSLDDGLVGPALRPDDVITLGPGRLTPGDAVPGVCPAAVASLARQEVGRQMADQVAVDVFGSDLED
jgi:hypothetical protein